MVGAADLDRHVADGERVAWRHLGHLDLHAGARTQISVMVEAILLVERQHRAQAIDDLLGADRTIDACDDGVRRHDPARGNDVVQVADVIAVQVCQKDCREKWGKHASSSHAHDATTTAVDHDVLTCGLHKCRWPRAIRIGNRATGAKQRYFHRWHLLLISPSLGVA